LSKPISLSHHICALPLMIISLTPKVLTILYNLVSFSNYLCIKSTIWIFSFCDSRCTSSTKKDGL